MKTPKQWLDEVISDENKLVNWLKRQFIGEQLAAQRISELSKNPELLPKSRVIICKIAEDEAKHAAWIEDLLKMRKVDLPEISYDNDRYWKAVLPNAHSLDQLLAAGHHAEAMRLKRIELLATDIRVPIDIRCVFRDIYKDEKFHAAAFEALASDDAIAEMKDHHEVGLEYLGLEI